MRRRMVRVAAPVAMAVGLVVAMALPAAAHVTLHSTDAVQGGSDALILVRVPNEEDPATTTRVELDFPLDAPLLGLLVEPTPGWTFEVTQTTLATPITTDDGTVTQVVSRVVWSGGSIPVGGFQDFHLDVSTLPKVPTLVVKTLQTYSNGDVVRWIDVPAPGQPSPPHPAPTLDLAPPTPGSAGPTTTAAAGTATATTALGAAQTPAPGVSLQGVARTSDVHGARTLAVLALVAGILGLAAGGAALVMKGRRPAP